LNPFLSIVIPAHNEESRLPDTLEQLIRFLGKQTFTSEIIVVENESQDRTYALAKECGEPLLVKGGDFAHTDIAS